MPRLATALLQYIQTDFSFKITANPSGRIQPVLVGPPRDALLDLFNLMTSGHTTDWTEPTSARTVPVLLVDRELGSQEAGLLSQRCTWDYAVAIRNSVGASLSLVAPSEWGRRPESIANATETLGSAWTLTSEQLQRTQPWPFLLQMMANQFSVPLQVVRTLLKLIYEDTDQLVTTARYEIPWRVVDGMLQVSTIADALRVAGFPAIGRLDRLEVEILKSSKALHHLSSFCYKVGLKESRERLQAANSNLLDLTQTWADVTTELNDMFDHLEARAGSGTTFSNHPTGYYSPSDSARWWDALTHRVLTQLLEDAGAVQSNGKVDIRVSNALFTAEAAADEPNVVERSVRIEVSSGIAQPNLLRQLGRVGVPITVLSGVAEDPNPPTHDRVFVYKANAHGYKQGDVKVLSLAEFTARGYARVDGALSNPPPGRGKAEEPFHQEITLSRSGPCDLIVYRAPEARSVRVTPKDGGPLVSSAPVAVFTMSLETGDELSIDILDVDGEPIGQWILTVQIDDEETDEPHTRFEGLVQAHQKNKNIGSVRVRETFARRLERSYLLSEGSWRGIVACWDEGDNSVTDPDWSSQRWGDVPVLTDVRVPSEAATPPKRYLEIRNQLRSMLLESRHSIGEAILSDPNMMELVQEYLDCYTNWADEQPEAAAWVDCIALHAPKRNVQAGEATPSGEPIVLLLSPLHPLRLGWHCLAETVMTEKGKRCPAAGLLDPHASPGVIGLPIYANGTRNSWVAFFAGGCNEPYWLLLWNQHHLNETPEHAAVQNALRRLSFEPTGVTGGFTEAQTRRALSDIQGLLSARATLRVGLVGTGGESTGSVNGLFQWCRSVFTQPSPGAPQSYPIGCDIYDFRVNRTEPSAAMIADLSDETGERVRWFRKGAGPVDPNIKLDLIILDQLETSESKGVRADGRSAVSHGALVRLNLRQDPGNAEVLRESRIGWYGSSPYGSLWSELGAALETAEALATNTQQGTSHLEFRPNGAAIHHRLGGAHFVAATSSQIDPACFIRGVQQDGAYLWDFELPGSLGFEEGRSGYYLVAKPPDTLLTAITDAAHLITDNPPAPQALLEAIAKRGIPMLKRMAAGGSYSKGELGMVLAVHLLQDSFRANNSGVRLPVSSPSGDLLHFILPVDSYWRPLDEMRRVLEPTTNAEHPDLLVFAIHVPDSGRVRIKVTPVEVKFRESSMTGGELHGARKQAQNMGRLLSRLWGSSSVPENLLWSTCGSALLAQCLDQCFRVYADPGVHFLSEEDWGRKHEQVLRGVLVREAEVSVNKSGRLLVFDASEVTTDVSDLDGDNQNETVIVSKQDAAVLLVGTGTLSGTLQDAFASLGFTFDAGSTAPDDNAVNLPPNPDVGTRAAVTAVEQPETAGFPTRSTTPENGIQYEPDPDILEPSLPSPGGVPNSVRQRVRTAFDSFIGNSSAVKRITNDVLKALISSPPHLSKNYLFTGQPSTGKTELARRMATALDLPFIPLDGRSLTSRERLFELVRGEVGDRTTQVGEQAGLPVYLYPPFVVFIDEVHLVPRAVQESLLTMLEAADRTATLNSHIARVPHATFLFATTRSSEVDPAFRTRCAQVELSEYELDEVAEILKRKLQKGWPDTIYREIAKLGRCVPRVAIELAEELDTEVMVTEHPGRSLKEHLEEVRKARSLDELGLTNLDLQYLQLLLQEDRPLGEQTIANLLGTVDRDRVIDEIEPYLRRLGFIRLGQRGREITDSGRDYVISFRRRK